MQGRGRGDWGDRLVNKATEIKEKEENPWGGILWEHSRSTYLVISLQVKAFLLVRLLKIEFKVKDLILSKIQKVFLFFSSRFLLH